MDKLLSRMSLTELWELFPIYLTEHQSHWRDWYEEERLHLMRFLPADEVIRISHIGSTAVKAIWAKPIIDILVETRPGCDWFIIKSGLGHGGYLCMSEKRDRISFNKGYTEEGFAEKVYHLHLRLSGDHDELYFRDYLNEHRRIAKAYEKLKLVLWRQYEHDRDAYTDHKTEFVKKYTQKAKNLYGDRYR